MINSELLKEAIADAKAVRVTAYANARASLQERFDKRFEAVFAEKLKNEAQEEEEEGMTEDVNPTSPPQITAGKGEATHAGAVKAIAKGKVKKVSDASTNFKTVAVGGAEGAKGSAAPKASVGIDENYEEEEGKVDESGFTSEDLDEIIRELESEVADEEDGRHVEEPVEVPHGFDEPVNVDPGAEADTEVEPGAEADTEVEPGGEEDTEVEPGAEADTEVEPGGEEDIEAEPGSHVDVGEEPGADVNVVPEPEGNPVPHPHVDGQEEINLEELLAALNEEAEEEEDEKKMDETMENHGLPKNVGGQDKSGGTNTYPKGPDASKKQLTGKNHNIQGKGNIGGGAVDGKPLHEVERYKTALKESYKTIEFLRGQINEVNLLNAKLLYTNKLFKEFATVIDEPYRMKIVEAFDLTKTVREVKLAYALLAESLNFGSKRIVTAPARSTQRVDPARRSIVRQITEGQASKPVASTKPSASVITESANVMVSRLQKLAGIKLPVAPKSK